jgi:hypothetical protein
LLKFATAGECTSFHQQLASFATGMAAAADTVRGFPGTGLSKYIDLESLLAKQAIPLPSING